MFVPQEELNRAQPTSALCWSGMERKRWRLVVEETEEQMGRVFLDYETALTLVSLFRYLGQTLLSSNNNCLAVERNLWRAQRKWGWISEILGREGEDRRTTGRFYVEVVQVVILFGSKTWYTMHI